MSDHQRVILGMQEQLEKYGYTVIGCRVSGIIWEPGQIIRGIDVTPKDSEVEHRDDINLCVIGPATLEEWERHCKERGDCWDASRASWEWTAFKVVAE